MLWSHFLNKSRQPKASSGHTSIGLHQEKIVWINGEALLKFDLCAFHGIQVHASNLNTNWTRLETQTWTRKDQICCHVGLDRSFDVLHNNTNFGTLSWDGKHYVCRFTSRNKNQPNHKRCVCVCVPKLLRSRPKWSEDSGAINCRIRKMQARDMQTRTFIAKVA